MPHTPIAIADVAPDRASYRPGDPARITVTLTPPHTSGPAQLMLVLTHLDETVVRQARDLLLAADTAAQVTFMLPLPLDTPRGYGLEATLYDAHGQVLATGSGALDVLERWSQAPRYGFLSDFAPGQHDVPARCDSLLRNHLNVVQFYDWMWRHYVLLPPADQVDPADQGFTDALGRRLSLATVRAAIAAVQARGAAALAYGAVYGAEPEYADAHPELVLLDEQGQRVSLAELFYIMNIAPDSPWTPQIVAEFARCVRELGFDGIHLDQYGFPKTARTAAGQLVDLSEHFPPLIDAARAAVVAVRPGAGVIFNAVGNWPIETVAPTTQDVVYIEVWPPDESYNDLRRLIAEARRLSRGKPVILAAYLAPFLDCPPELLPQAEAAALLATAAIAAGGGSHLLLGEHDGILCDPYYPKYARLRPAFVPCLHAYYDFVVRYEEWLVAAELRDWPEAELTLDGVPATAPAVPGQVWAITRRRPGYGVINLINLADQAALDWNALRTPPTPRGPIVLELAEWQPVQRVLLLVPGSVPGQPVTLEFTQAGGRLHTELPQLHVWAVLVCVLADARG
ncbi:MAG: hypothetical protein IPP13_04250 [Kouleothrix sp.]|jgi:dextranase|nr:hypothetical protein [Kouleothrix sp.]